MSSNNTGLDDAGDIFDHANARTLAPTAVGLQVAIMSVISIITILLFNFLRPKNKVCLSLSLLSPYLRSLQIIYEPKVKYHVGDKVPPKISESQFGWLPPLFRTQEAELLDKVGLDAVTYLRFLRLLRWLFTCIALLTCAILIPINVMYNLRFVPSTDRDVLSMLTIRDVAGSWLFIHVAASYAITLLVCIFVHYHWKAVLQLRYDWFRSPEYIQAFYARTLLIRRVPKKYHTDEGLREVFEGLQIPYPTTSVHIGRKVGKLPELIEYHNAIVREFEQVLIRSASPSCYAISS
jgi:calcium permeable stress-gated cation channel